MDEALTLDDFPLISSDKLRYSDTDRQGHVNNAVFATFFETGRVEFTSAARHAAARAEQADTGHGSTAAAVSDTEFVLARITIDYLHEVLWPGTVTVGTRILRLGTSSVTAEQALFVDDELCARSESVMVQLRTSTRRPEPLAAAMRDFLDSLTARAAGSLTTGSLTAGGRQD